MRLLPVLLFVLSAIPLCTTLKCYTEMKMEREIAEFPNAEVRKGNENFTTRHNCNVREHIAK